MAQYGYGGRANPFDQRDDGGNGGYGGGYNDGYGGGGGGGYGAPQPARPPPPGAFGQGPRPGGGGARYNNGPSMGRDEYGSGNVEMASLAQNASSPGNGNPNAILDECLSIDKGISNIESKLQQLSRLYKSTLSASNPSNISQQIDGLNAEIMAMYRQLTDRVRLVKSDKDARKPMNARHIGMRDANLKAAIEKFYAVEAEFRKSSGEQAARQYRIVKPEASEAEVRAVAADPVAAQQVFQQAMMQSDRQGQARAVLSAVQDRQAALEKIEQQMIELAQLMQDMDVLVVQQEEQIIQIEQKGEEVVENLDKGNVEMGTAVVTARATRKKKWICLGICVTIVVVIVVAVVAYVMINRSANGATKKRSIAWGPEGAPVAAVYAQSKIVTPDALSASEVMPLSHFAGARSMKYGKRYIIVDTNDLPGGGNS